MSGILERRRVLLGVTGGIAAYKTPELVRALRREGADVRVVMTKSAHQFVASLALQTVSERAVASDLFDPAREAEIAHIELADSADVVLVAPATADLLARARIGRADDLLTTILLATTAPVVLAPAMNVNMFRHAAVRENLAVLESRGAIVVPPGAGELACGWEGEGRLPDSPVLVDAAAAAATARDLDGLRILVSAGPTREPLDPVRYVTNRSSGKMGWAIARAARRHGAEVTLVAGPTDLPDPWGVRVSRVETAREMAKAVESEAGAHDVVVMAAAVADYAPAAPAKQKVKKSGDRLAIELEKTVDILAGLGTRTSRRPALVVGFAAETEKLEEHARAKLAIKGADWILANEVGAGLGFEVEANQVLLLTSDGGAEQWPLLDKDGVAERFIGRVRDWREARSRVAVEP